MAVGDSPFLHPRDSRLHQRYSIQMEQFKIVIEDYKLVKSKIKSKIHWNVLFDPHLCPAFLGSVVFENQQASIYLAYSEFLEAKLWKKNNKKGEYRR